MTKKQEFDVEIEGHEYDGIKEFNNPLPKWWLATFYGTIIFSIFYWGYYEVLGGPSHDEKLAARLEKVQQAQDVAAAEFAAQENIDLDALLGDEAALAVGKEHFDKTCVTCHGENGEGSVGPNLTDSYWIHSQGDIAGILYSIRTGFPEKGMPPWGPVIPREDHAKLAAYVITLQGTEPPNPKAPEGQLVE